MTIDLDEIVQTLLPWKLELLIMGQLYVTRRPNMAEYLMLINIGNMEDDPARKLLCGLFEPPLEKLIFPVPLI